MPKYIDSKGNEKDTTQMPYSYLKNALNKAQENQHDENIAALTEEIVSRPEHQEQNPTE